MVPVLPAPVELSGFGGFFSTPSPNAAGMASSCIASAAAIGWPQQLAVEFVSPTVHSLPPAFASSPQAARRPAMGRTHVASPPCDLPRPGHWPPESIAYTFGEAKVGAVGAVRSFEKGPVHLNATHPFMMHVRAFEKSAVHLNARAALEDYDSASLSPQYSRTPTPSPRYHSERPMQDVVLYDPFHKTCFAEPCDSADVRHSLDRVRSNAATPTAEAGELDLEEDGVLSSSNIGKSLHDVYSTDDERLNSLNVDKPTAVSVLSARYFTSRTPSLRFEGDWPIQGDDPVIVSTRQIDPAYVKDILERAPSTAETRLKVFDKFEVDRSAVMETSEICNRPKEGEQATRVRIPKKLRMRRAFARVANGSRGHVGCRRNMFR